MLELIDEYVPIYPALYQRINYKCMPFFRENSFSYHHLILSFSTPLSTHDPILEQGRRAHYPLIGRPSRVSYQPTRDKTNVQLFISGLG
ncbi:hypothetical protein HZ326_14592 [Fusarium oxysporum f. sp. albedinis]|nr:hypothetical protein HZ326_14592 [Fusarium oxysporum f. sp. albedinis]